jgi:aryl-alcohol dehydrogenase-like predicted oxidoreductase
MHRRIILGTWGLSHLDWGGSAPTLKTLSNLMAAASDRGVEILDTAPVYNTGEIEGLIGQTDLRLRNKFKFSGKAGLVWNTPYDSKSVRAEYSQASILKSLHESLSQIKMDSFAYYWLHYPNFKTTSSFNEALFEGLMANSLFNSKVLNLGLANPRPEDILQETVFAGLQFELNLLQQWSIKKVLTPAKTMSYKNLWTFSPLAKGLLSGKYRPGVLLNKWDHRRDLKLFTERQRQDNQIKIELLQPLCEEHSCSLAQIALRWILDSFPEVSVLIGPKNPEQLEDLMDAQRFSLSQRELSDLNHIFRQEPK